MNCLRGRSVLNLRVKTNSMVLYKVSMTVSRIAMQIPQFIKTGEQWKSNDEHWGWEMTNDELSQALIT